MGASRRCKSLQLHHKLKREEAALTTAKHVHRQADR